MASTYLVTGGAGFIASHVIETLLKRGHKVVALDNLNDYYDPKVKRRNLKLLKAYKDFTFANGDIRNKGTITRVMRKARPDHVIHEAAQAGVRYSVQNPKEVMDINLTGTLNLLEASRKHDVKKMVNASSSSVYGVVKHLPFDEDHPTNPVSPYGVSKLAAEHYCRIYQDLYGLRTVSLRYFTVFGPRMRPDLAINIFTHAALRNRPIEIFGTGRKTRDFTYIDNAVDGTLKAVRKGQGEYNIGGGKRINILQLARKIIHLTRSRSKIVHSKDAEGDMEHTLSSITKAKRELGYKVKVDIDAGLKRYVDWVRKGSR